MATAQVNGISMYYELAGKGEPLVIINGLGADISEFASVAELFTDNCHVLTFDNRGAGRTDEPDEPYSIEQMANDTAGLMEAVGFKQANILGISMGGRIALELALSRPNIVKRLVLVSAAARSVRRHKTVGNFLAFDVLPRLPIMKGTYPQPYYAFRRQREASSSYDCPERLNELQITTLITHGSKDKTAPLFLAEELHEGIKNSRLEIFKGGHLFFMFRDRQRFIDIVKTFLAC
jgi:3-oxoadipate enol-lactonase